jgi:hypothetical protein
MPKYFMGLDRAAAGRNPFMAVIAIGLAMVDLSLAVDHLRAFQATLPPLGLAGSTQTGLGGADVSSPELLGAVGLN